MAASISVRVATSGEPITAVQLSAWAETVEAAFGYEAPLLVVVKANALDASVAP